MELSTLFPSLLFAECLCLALLAIISLLSKMYSLALTALTVCVASFPPVNFSDDHCGSLGQGKCPCSVLHEEQIWITNFRFCLLWPGMTLRPVNPEGRWEFQAAS